MTIEDEEAGQLLVTVRRAAEVLALGRSTIYELIGSGDLEAVHVGRATRVPVEALHSFVAARRAATAKSSLS